jgi:hypothetical protein
MLVQGGEVSRSSEFALDVWLAMLHLYRLDVLPAAVVVIA